MPWWSLLLGLVLVGGLLGTTGYLLVVWVALCVTERQPPFHRPPPPG
jgi:hypothetical protein